MSSANVLFDAPGPRARRASLIGSIIAGVLILGAVVWLVFTLAAERQSGGITLPGMFDSSRWEALAQQRFWEIVGEGVMATLAAAAIAAVGAIALGMAFSLMRSSEIAWVRIPTAWLIEFLRGMPVLLMMLFILLVASTGAFWAVVVALVLYNGTLIGEALRAGLASLPRGQREAALSVGMGVFQSKILVEFPQAFRQMLPIIVAQLVVLLKDTSLGYIVGYHELIRSTMNQLSAALGNRYLFTLFAVTLVIYLVINLSLSWFARWLSRRTSSGYGSSRKAKRAAGDVDPDQAILVAKANAAAGESETNSGR
ncbi:ABC transporter permease subunit [Microbacterium marmarense]|uniref:ABC transporter permease subunit n=1 Tax=Microbacterium marmarense TaxID=3122051 RepID=A0ABU8LVH4_9MICO